MSPRKRKRWANAHCHDRNRHLDRLLREGAGRCRWCERPIVRVRSLKRAGLEIVLDTHFDVTWRTAAGELARASKATLDHVASLASGGARTEDNLVAACARCNHDRNATENRKLAKNAPPTTWRDRHPVPDDDRELGDPGA